MDQAAGCRRAKNGRAVFITVPGATPRHATVEPVSGMGGAVPLSIPAQIRHPDPVDPCIRAEPDLTQNALLESRMNRSGLFASVDRDRAQVSGIVSRSFHGEVIGGAPVGSQDDDIPDRDVWNPLGDR